MALATGVEGEEVAAERTARMGKVVGVAVDRAAVVGASAAMGCAVDRPVPYGAEAGYSWIQKRQGPTAAPDYWVI